MDSSLDNIWDEPLVQDSPKRAIDVGDDSGEPSRPTKRARRPLFLADSDDDLAESISAHPADPPQGVDIDAIFAGVDDEFDDDESMLFKPLAPTVDEDAIRRQAEARYGREMPPLTPREILPSSSPPRDFDDLGAQKKGKGAKGDKNEKNEKKDRRRIVRLDEGRLLLPIGFPALIKATKDFRIKGKGHEETDLNRLLQVYQYWTHQLYPKTQFRDTVERVEKLCHSRRMHVSLSVWRDEVHGKFKNTADDDDEEGVGDGDADIDMDEAGLRLPPSSPSRTSSRVSSRPPSSLGPSDVDEPASARINRPALTTEEEESQAFWESLDDVDPDSLPEPRSAPPTTSNSSMDQDEMMWDIFNEMENQTARSSNTAATATTSTVAPPQPPPPADPKPLVAEPPGNPVDEVDDWDDMYL